MIEILSLAKPRVRALSLGPPSSPIQGIIAHQRMGRRTKTCSEERWHRALSWSSSPDDGTDDPNPSAVFRPIMTWTTAQAQGRPPGVWTTSSASSPFLFERMTSSCHSPPPPAASLAMARQNKPNTLLRGQRRPGRHQRHKRLRGDGRPSHGRHQGRQHGRPPPEHLHWRRPIHGLPGHHQRGADSPTSSPPPLTAPLSSLSGRYPQASPLPMA